MPDEDKNNEVCELMEKPLKKIYTPQLTQSIEAVKKVMVDLAQVSRSIMQSEAVQAMGRLAEHLQNFKITLPRIEISEEMKDIIGQLKYLEFLKEIKWPLYLLDDDILREKLKPFSNVEGYEYDIKGINSIILNYMTSDYIEKIASRWKDSTVIDRRVLPILQEAVELYKIERFYGCVSILMCQLEGVITETYQMQIDNGISFTADDIRLAYEHYNSNEISKDNIRIKSERSKLLCIITKTQNGILYWMAAVDYIYNTILTSDENMNQSNHPCRNKICHGIQMNYGSKEHAVKSILSMDIMIRLAEEMRQAIESKNDEEL